MEGEKRKRKLENEEEEDEEQKMEKFYALIKSTKDVRDLLSKEKIDKKVDDEKAKGIWTPTFQPEDFIDYGEFGRRNTSTPQAAGSSEKEKEKEKEKEVIIEKDYLQEATTAAVEPAAKTEDNNEKASDHILDLNLSL